jgi:alpha-2-macroglobulin
VFNAEGEADVELAVPPLAPGEDRLPWRYSLSVRARDDQSTFANASTTFFLSPTEVIGALRASAKLVKKDAPARLLIRATTLSGKPSPNAEGTATLRVRSADGAETAAGTRSFKTSPDGISELELQPGAQARCSRRSP